MNFDFLIFGESQNPKKSRDEHKGFSTVRQWIPYNALLRAFLSLFSPSPPSPLPSTALSMHNYHVIIYTQIRTRSHVVYVEKYFNTRDIQLYVYHMIDVLNDYIYLCTGQHLRYIYTATDIPKYGISHDSDTHTLTRNAISCKR